MIARRFLPKNVRELVHWYERYLSPIGLIGGFVADNLILLRRVDVWTTNALLGSYLIIAALGIVFINAAESGRVKSNRLLALVPFVPVVVQFSMGGLFSGYLSLYSRSAAFGGSWVFVVIVALLLLSNERFIRFYTRLPFQVSLYFVVLYSFLIFFLPVVFKRIGPDMFVISGVLSLGIIAAFQVLLAHVAPLREKEARTAIARSVVIIGLIFNILYFENLIPPLPLALKAGGLYHRVVHEPSGMYVLEGEEVPWYESFLRYNLTFHRVPGERAYVFTSIFAPEGLTTTIIHQWQRFDTTTNAWVTTADIPFQISGGRDAGYRGYTGKFDPAAGKWRVNVLTPTGQIITRISFTVVDATTTPRLVQSVL